MTSALSMQSGLSYSMRSHDLSLLVIFDAVMTEGSITRAAERLNITQPAVSNSVSRMREIWNDDLFIKDGRNIRPTLFANNLWAQVKDPLEQIDNAINPESFDPLISQRTFKVATTDLIVDLAWTDFRCRIEQEAPDVSVHTLPYTIKNGKSILDRASVDVVIGANDLMPSMETSEPLLALEYVCVMSHNHKLAKQKLTLERFIAEDQLLVSLSGEVTGYTDTALAEHGVHRRVTLTVNNFSSAVRILEHSNLIGVLPSICVEPQIKQGTLVMHPLPISVSGPKLSMFWHKRSDRDPGNRWLRNILKEVVRQEFHDTTKGPT